MLKRRVSWIILNILLYNIVLVAQNVKHLSPAEDSLVKSGFIIDSQKAARDAVGDIVRYTGLTPNFQIVEDPNIKNAIAYIQNGKRYIAYNPIFMLRVRDRTNSDWGAISVLAHEIGHHLSGHTLLKRKRDLQQEIDADRFSGFILYKMGAGLDQAKSVLEKLDIKSNPETHPDKEIRLTAITQGWLEANRLEERYTVKDSAIKAVPPPITSGTSINNPNKYIYKCMIYGDKNYYFIDSQNQIISVDESGSPYVVGYKVRSHDDNFKWIFSAKGITYGVDADGKMWNKAINGDITIAGKASLIAQ